MNNNKNHNHLLLLTTLGVYLGLLVVGSAPGLIAQQAAATTRNFELSEEIEVKDDLDKKPLPTEKELESSVEEYLKEVVEFIENLKALNSIEKFSSDFDTFDSESVTFAPCPETGGLWSHETESHIDRWLIPAITEAKFIAEKFSRFGDCLPLDGFQTGSEASNAAIKLKYDRSNLDHQLSIEFSSNARANAVHSDFNTAFINHKLDDEDDDHNLLKVLYKHTSLTVSDNKVFVVTNLPRAALDELLAADAK